jgi:hypothetical protein
LDADKTYVGFAAAGERAIDHGKEDRCVRHCGCVENLVSSRVVEG